MKSFALTPEQVLEVQQLLQEGYTAQDISKRFGIGMTSVHNYKNRLKAKGIILPDVRGQRPKGITPLNEEEATSANFIKVSVNGTIYKVTGKPKSVIISEDNVEVTY